jgi:hypothetical protein
MVGSEALRAIRNRGRVGEDELAYYEWYAERRPCLTEGCSHQVGSDGCVLDDVDALAEANPALGRRITLNRLRQFRRAMPPAEYAREFLSWWDEGPEEGGGPFGQGVWDKLFHPGSEIVEAPAFAVAVAGDRSWSCIGAHGRGPYGGHVESGAYQQHTDWLILRGKQLAAKNRGASFVLRVNSAAGALIDDFEAAGLNVIKASQQDYAQACGDFYDAVMAAEFHHSGQGELATAVGGTRKKAVGDGFCWDQQRSTTDIAPLEAVTLAHWASRRKKRAGGFMAF